MRKRNPAYKMFISSITALGGVILVIAVFVLYFNVYSQPRFYPTIEEAFRRRSGSGGDRMGEIIFIDEHEDSVTVLHWTRSTTPWARDNINLSNYIRVNIYGEYFFRCVSVARGSIALNPNPESIEQFQRSPHPELLNVGHPRWDISLYAVINRRPIYGVSHDSRIYNLHINGQPVDFVTVLREYSYSRAFGYVTTYWWYFSDLQFEPGDEIIITFE